MSISERTKALLARRDEVVPRGPFHVAPLVIERASGALVWDGDGRELIDFCGGIGALNVGHGHPRVVEAIQRQAERLIHTSFHVGVYEGYVRLAERLAALVPVDGASRTVLFNSGAEAVENAVKIARAATGRTAVVAFERGFHGRTLLTMSLTGKVRPYSAGFGPFAPEIYRLPYAPFFCNAAGEDERQVQRACRAALERLFSYHIEPERIAAVIVEPVLGEGGFFPIHPAAFRELREQSERHEIALIADEVQTGFARCGAMFACERYGISADLVTMAKSLAGGMVLSAVSGRAELMDAPPVGGIGGTYGGSPLACAAALAALDVIADEGLVERARQIGAAVGERFSAWAAEHPHVGEVRGLGAMCALEIVDPQGGRPAPQLAGRIAARALDHGLLIMTASGNVLRTLMPLVISDEQLERGLDALGRALAEVQS